jgi:polar amino acid transport system permease protein
MTMNELAANFFNVEVLRVSLSALTSGLGQTLLLALLVIPLGGATGLILAAACVVSGSITRYLLFAWIDFFRAFPPLVLLIYLFYGAPMLGYEMGAYSAIAWTFTLNTSSYFAEIFRAGIESVPKGQWEAARASGMSWIKSFLVIVLPQGVRTVLPDIVSNVVTVTQLTSLASVVGVHELLHAAQASQGTTYNVSPLIAAALMYLVILWPFVRLVSRLEARLRNQSSARARHRQQRPRRQVQETTA